MGRKSDEGLLGANFPREFVEEFWAKAAPDGENKGVIIRAMAKLWLELPIDTRRIYLYSSDNDCSIKELIEHVLVEYGLIDKVFLVPGIHKKAVRKKNSHDKAG